MRSSITPFIKDVYVPRLRSVTFESTHHKLDCHLLSAASRIDYSFLTTVTDMTFSGFYDPLFLMPPTVKLRSLFLLLLHDVPQLSELKFPELRYMTLKLDSSAKLLPQVNADGLEKLTLMRQGNASRAVGDVVRMASSYQSLCELTIKDLGAVSKLRVNIDGTIKLRGSQLKVISLAYINLEFLQDETGIELSELKSLSIEHDANYQGRRIRAPNDDEVECFCLNLKADRLEYL